MQDGLGLLLWRDEGFAFADSFDEDRTRFVGLRAGKPIEGSLDSVRGLLVKPQIAAAQLDAATTPDSQSKGSTESDRPEYGEPPSADQAAEPNGRQGPNRFYGNVALDPARVGRDAGRIAEEIISHLMAATGSVVKVTLDIEATLPEGATENVVRTVTENARTLRFTAQNFE